MKQFFGWRVVWAGFIVALLGSGAGFYGPSIYLYWVIERTGWSLALVSSAVTFHFLTGAFFVACLPALYERHGVPMVTAAGAPTLALGVVGWAVAATPWQLFIAAAISGAGWAALGAAAINAIVAPWFISRRPAALSLAYNGINIGGMIFSVLWVRLFDAIGPVAATALVGAGMIFIVGTLSRQILSKTPADLGQAPDGDSPGIVARSVTSPRARPLPGSALWTDRGFLTLAAGMALALFAQIGLLAHLFSLLVPVLGKQGAGLSLSLVTACAIAGRTLTAYLLPANADRRTAICASYAVQLVGSIVLIVAIGQSAPLLVLGLVLFGSGLGNAMSLPPLIAQVEFVQEDVRRVVALIIAIGQTAYAFAPATFGILRATTISLNEFTVPTTTAFFAVTAIVQIAAIACMITGRRSTRSHE